LITPELRHSDRLKAAVSRLPIGNIEPLEAIIKHDKPLDLTVLFHRY
jgi:hypothetical protein